MKNPLILIVDDEETALEIRRMLLENAGYSVLATSHWSAAVQAVQSKRVDLVISDHLLIGFTGAQLARKVKEINSQIPVILLSGVNEIPEDAEDADLFISKLEGPVVLLEKVAAVLAATRVSEASRKGHSAAK